MSRSWLDVPPVGLEELAVRQTLFDDVLFQQMRAAVPAINSMIGLLERDYGYTVELAQDTFAQLYQSAVIVRERREMVPDLLANHAVATNLGRSPDVLGLKAFTQHDKYSAARATMEVVDVVRQYLREHREAQDAAEQQRQARQDAEDTDQQAQAGRAAHDAALQALAQALADLAGAMGDFDGNGPLTEQQAQAQAGVDQAQAAAALTEQQLQALLELAQAALAALEQADAEVEEAADAAERATRTPVAVAVRETVDALTKEAALFRAWGVEPGEIERMDFETRARMAKSLSDHRLSEFVKELGRWRVMETAQYARHVADAREEAYDVTLSGRLPDVLPSEFAALATVPGKVQFAVKLSEGQLLSRKYRGTEKIGQGAIGVMVDTSTSMKRTDVHGIPRELFAKGFALAMLDQARREKRDFFCIAFANADNQRLWHFKNGQGTLPEVLDLAGFFFGGGTNFERPMDMGVEILREQFTAEGKAQGDLCLITDDECAVSPQWLKNYQEVKAKLNFRTFGVAVGMPRPGATLASLSDNVRSVQEFGDPTVVADIFRTV